MSGAATALHGRGVGRRPVERDADRVGTVLRWHHAPRNRDAGGGRGYADRDRAAAGRSLAVGRLRGRRQVPGPDLRARWPTGWRPRSARPSRGCAMSAATRAGSFASTLRPARATTSARPGRSFATASSGRIDASAAAAARAQSGATSRCTGADPASVQIAGWDAVGSMDASADTIYSIVVPTLADSNGTGLHRVHVLRARGDRDARACTTTRRPTAATRWTTCRRRRRRRSRPRTRRARRTCTGAPNSEADLWYYRVYRGSSAGLRAGAVEPDRHAQRHRRTRTSARRAATTSSPPST